MIFHFYYQSCAPQPDLTPPQVSVHSRAFLFGDHVYEVLRTYRGIPFGIEAHFERLLSSLDYLKYSVYPAFETFQKDLLTLTQWAYQRLGLKDDLYIRVHFGRQADHKIGLYPAPNLVPVWVYYASALQNYCPDHSQELRLGVAPVFRNHPLSFSPNAKTGNYLNNMLGHVDAVDRGFNDAVFLSPVDERLVEGSTFNIAFLDAEGTLIFMDPGEVPGYLFGVTQRVFTDTTSPQAPRWRYEPVTLERAREFPYALAISTLREIQWIAQIENIRYQKPPQKLLDPLVNYLHATIEKDLALTQERFSAASRSS
jgi:branched-subunit amino acid aminotransferase/4-amino-4-deoxychorismate lyase